MITALGLGAASFLQCFDTVDWDGKGIQLVKSLCHVCQRFSFRTNGGREARGTG